MPLREKANQRRPPHSRPGSQQESRNLIRGAPLTLARVPVEVGMKGSHYRSQNGTDTALKAAWRRMQPQEMMEASSNKR